MTRSAEDLPASQSVVIAMVAVFLSAFLAAAAGAPVRSSYGARITGDEPEYLLTAISLGEERSLDVSDELRAQRYRPFHEINLKPQAKVVEGGRMVSPHDPLLPALLVPGALAGGWLGARLTLALMAGALACVLLWTAVRRLELPVWRSAAVISVFTASAPLAVYGSQLYPEIPAALALAVAVVCITGPLRRRGLAGLVLSVVALAWLGAKFVPVAAALTILALWRLYRAGRRRELAAVVAVFAVAAAGYATAHLRWYGGWTVYAAGAFFAETGEFSVIGTDPGLADRSSRLIGLLVDRRFGLAAWQPAWLLVIAAVPWVLRRRPNDSVVLVLPLAAGWLSATYLALTMHGWWWPGRQLVVVLPAAVLAIAAWATRSRRFWSVMALGATGTFTLAWLFVEGWRGRLTMVVDFYNTTNPVYRAWAGVLPDYILLRREDWILHGIWVAVAFAVLLAAGGAAMARDLVRRLGRPRTAG